MSGVVLAAILVLGRVLAFEGDSAELPRFAGSAPDYSCDSHDYIIKGRVDGINDNKLTIQIFRTYCAIGDYAVFLPAILGMDAKIPLPEGVADSVAVGSSYLLKIGKQDVESHLLTADEGKTCTSTSDCESDCVIADLIKVSDELAGRCFGYKDMPAKYNHMVGGQVERVN